MGVDIFNDLIGIAEIATVFIGFAVLISVLAVQSSNRVQVMGIVVGATMTLVACLLPVLFRTFQIDALLIVRASSATFIPINLLATAAMFFWIPDMKETFVENSIVSASAWVFEAIVYVLLACCAFNVLENFSITFYFGAVLTLLFQVIFLFLSLTISLSQQSRDT